MQITFDTSNPHDLAILNKIINLSVEGQAQPQVAQNSGTIATALPLSAEGNGVSESAAPAAAPAPEKKAKAKKSAPAVEAPSEEPSTASVTSAAGSDKPEVKSGQEWAKAANLDEVRAALQAFTATKGVPAGIELLKKYGAGRVSELAEENYGAFIAECQ